MEGRVDIDLDSVLVFVEENQRGGEEGRERKKSHVRRIQCDPLSIKSSLRKAEKRM